MKRKKSNLEQWPADEVTRVAVEKLVPYARNSRVHSKEQVAQIAASMKEWGWTNPVLIDESGGIIAGHGRVLAARKLGYDEIPCMVAKNWTDAQKKAYVIADNQLALNADWDFNLLNVELGELKEIGFDVSLIGFDEKDLQELGKNASCNEDNPYSDKVDTPHYEPTGEKPHISELYNDEKSVDLIADIKNSSLPESDKQFLMLAASRHVVFNYQMIAEYYSHASKECQELMEDNALVIIDFNKAIKNGYAKLSEQIANNYLGTTKSDNEE